MRRIRLNSNSVQLVIVALFVAVLLASNVASTKLIGVPGIKVIIDGGTVLFPLAYVLGDIITEVYGFKKARLIILCGFVSLLLMSIVFYVVQIAPSAQGWEKQLAFESVLGLVPRIAIGSLIAYLVGEILNSYVMARMKVLSKGKHLWARALGSTIVGALADTIIFSMIAFYGTIPPESLFGLIATVYLIKLAVEVLVLPITYRVICTLRAIEGNDRFDTNLSRTMIKD